MGFKIFFAVFFFPVACLAQKKDSTSSFSIGGYVDTYYASYSDSAGTNKYQKFSAVSPRSNLFGLNIAQLTGTYTSDHLRVIATFHYGDIPSSAWSPVLNTLQETNVGIRLAKKLWLDAGLFKTHIGTEALLPKDNIASSISAITFFEPWYQAGAKLTYTPNERFSICLHLLNGYNTFVEVNGKKSVGLALLYVLGTKGNIGYFNLLGDASPAPDLVSHLRFLNNLVFNYQFSKKFKMSAGADFILQQKSNIADSSKTAFIYSGILTFRYQAFSKLGIYLRGEAFSDPEGFLSGIIVDAKNKLTGYKLTGETIGLEYKSTDNSYIRLEERVISMDPDQKIFRTNGANTNVRTDLMLNFGIWF